MSLAALQLLHVNSKLASWVHSTSHASLPSDLQHGPVLLLHGAAENADSPHTSSRLLDDTLVFLTYGVSYLSGHGDRAHLLARLEDSRTQRAVDRTNLHIHALRIQTQFRCQRFATHRLASLEFATSESLIPEVQEKMNSSSPNSRDLITTAAVTVDDEELQLQIDKYASELRARVEARKREAELQRQRQQRERREQEDLKKKQFYQKRRRHENACRRWNYFSGRLLRLHRDENHEEIQSRVETRRRTVLPTDQQPVITRSSTIKRIGGGRSLFSSSSRQFMSTTPSAGQLAKKRNKPLLRRTASSSLMKNALHRNFIRQFAAKAIARGLSRVLCESNMSVGRSSGSAKTAPPEANPSQQQQPERVLRIGVLLCDVHFGAKYMGLYQRFLERAASEQGFASIEWQFFDCIKSQFPTRALQRMLHGFLVAGVPNNGVNHAQQTAGTECRPDTSESTTSSNGDDDRQVNARLAKRSKRVGPWRKNLQKLLRQIYSDNRAVLCGLGLGHVVLAEALGAKCDHDDWEDGWSVLDPKLFDAKVLDKPPGGHGGHGGHGTSERSRPISKYVGIKYLHGEFVQSMDFAPRGMRVWRSLDQRFVSCFKDKWVLSFDGFPECGTFVFETMGELYDREKAAAVIEYQQNSKPTISRRESIAEGDTFETLLTSRFGFTTPAKPPQRQLAAGVSDLVPARRVGVIDAVLTLEEKKKLLDVTDISQAVAHALVDHFQAAITTTSALPTAITPHANGSAEGGSSSVKTATTEVAAVVNPIDCIDIEESIRVLAASCDHEGGSGVTSICLRVRSTLDGHLVVLGAQLDAFVRNHERKVRESRRPSLLSSPHSSVLMRKNSRAEEDVTAALMLSLHTLRDQKLVLLDDAASSLPSSQGSNSSVEGSGSSSNSKQRMAVNLPIQLPTLSMSSSSASPFEGIAVPNSSTTTTIGNGIMSSINDVAAAQVSSNRKRPPQVVKRVKSSAMGVLTLSEALTRFQTELSVNLSARAIADKRQQVKASPSVIIQFPDEEICSYTSTSSQPSFQLQRKSPDELRLLWVRLVAALRVSEIADERVCLLSRQTSVLDFFRKRQPLWTFIKDCRRSASLPPRHHVRRVSWYARYADILLFDQEMLLSNSAKENEALFLQARYYGLKVFVAREEKTAAGNGDASNSDNNISSTSSTRSLDDNRKRSSKRLANTASPQKLHPHRASTFSGAGIIAKAAADKERAMEEDLQIVEILLLQLTGIDGVLTSTPEIAIEATQKLLSKSPIMNQVEQLFRTWQSKDRDKSAVAPLPKRPSLQRSGNAGNVDDLLGGESEDYMGEAHERDDDVFLDDKEVALKMTRQYAEHGVRRPPSSSYVPLRPLQPKRGEQVLGVHQQQQRQSSFPIGSAGAGASNSEAARNQLRSIGTFRNAFQRSQTVRSPPYFEGTHMQQTLDDDRITTRSSEVALSFSSLPNSSMLLQVPLKVSMQSPRVRRLNQAPAVGNSAPR